MPTLRSTTALRRGRSGIALAVLLGVAALLGPGAPSAEAAPPTGPAQGLEVTVSGWSGEPTLTLRNASSVPCQITTSDLGSAQLVVVEQGGAGLPPISAPAAIAEGLQESVTTRLVTLEPGAARTVPLTVLSDGSGTSYLESLAWSDSGAVASLYAFDPTAPLTLSATYTVPVIVAGTVPVCSTADPAAAPVGLAATKPTAGPGGVSGGSGVWVYLLGGGLVLLAAVIVLLQLIRRGRRGGAAAAAILIAVGLLTVAVRPPDARAELSADTAAAGDYATCMAIFRAPGGDPAGILPTLDDPDNRVQINGNNKVENSEIHVPGTKISIITWNAADQHPYVGGGNAEKCSSLYHEMNHAYDDNNGGQDTRDCFTAGPDGKLVDSKIKITEVNATRAQNKYRTTHGLPPRTTYGDDPLPSGECKPPPPKDPPKPPPVKPTGSTNGDPHLATFDGRFYDFQAVGEFVAAIDSRGGFEVQVRQQQFADFADVAVNTAIALDVAGDKVEIASGIAGMTLTVGGEARPLDDGTLLRGGTIEIRAGERGPEVLVTWPDASLANLSQIGTFGLLLRLRPAEAHAGHLRGLLGDFDGDPGNDVRIKGGDVITPTFGTLYPSYADSWRIAQADSLFAYASGKTTASYTDKSFPRAATSLEGIANLPRARAICIAAGIADPTQLENCMLDVGLTGHTEFADAYADAITSEASGSLTVDGAAVHVNLWTGQPTARYTFAGTAGQQIYVQATASTVPSECNVLRLYDPSGAAIASGCLIGGAGQIDTTTLPSTGTYTIAVAPAGGVAGTVTLKVLSVASTTNALTIDGPAVVATIAQPGGTASYTFSTTGPVDVYVQLSASTLPDQCSAVDLTDASGLTLGDGCVIGGEGEIDQTHLGAGSYTITVDPDNSATGRVTLKLIKDTNQTGSIAINGSAATGTIAQPGGTSTFTFKGAVGQKVAVEVSGSTFDDQCDLVELKQPNGAEIASACSISGKGSVDQIALPVSGEYTIVVNAYGPGTGSVRLKLTG